MVNNSWRITGLRVRAGSTDILNGIDASLDYGTISLLIGPNGAGKTTLLETIAGLRRVEEGTITLGGLPLIQGRRVNRDVLLRTGISFQQSSSQWFLPTVAEEFRYSLRPYRLAAKEPALHERMMKALEAAGLEASLPFLTRDPRTLSGGQQKRLALAMLLATEPEWLLLDEPTAGLDMAGVTQLRSILSAHRARGGGALIVTHDIEALLPLADTVIIVEAGRIRAIRTAIEHAKIIGTAESCMPQPLAVARQLRESGIEVHGGGPPWAAPRELATALASKLHGNQTCTASSEKLYITKNETSLDEHSMESFVPPAEPSQAAKVIPDRGRSMWRSFWWPSAPVRDDRYDPRAIIVSYYLFATGALLQQSWYGLLAVTLIAYLFVWRPLSSAIAPWRGAVVMYIRMIMIFVLFAGININPLSFSVDAALITGFRLSKLFVIMVTGLPITAMVTPLRLQRALEQTFGWLERFRVPVRQAALTIALIFRFVPMLINEWDRFVRIALARGKLATRPGRLPARMIYTVLAPFLHGMLRSADELTNALEARGFGRVGITPTRALILRWTKADYIMVVLFTLLFAFMFMLQTVVS
ncbi:ATP-binding cassette domain-containing protein [Paenibacillus xylaniclasticus]|uniref:ATP-binding cassette domain-containing protein n=1 Tax=Paenibacillus xylaniclasticus TaxID=588083 RepID=UPI000FDC5924|nr:MULTISPECIES: ATP-binding cassette domain-containing protein [Paenibacillus]GFN31807.1 hypothetical protein PCURB6_20670 [Paenibacillus curdlanolyticus]